MKEVEVMNELNLGNDKVIDYTITQINPLDFFPLNSTAFKTTMKKAGVANVESADAMRGLFVTWLIGVKKNGNAQITTADVIRISKLSKEDKIKLGNEFVDFFNKRPVYGEGVSTEDIKAHLRDYAKMVYNSRKQIFFKEELKYPANIKIKNETTYEAMRKDVFGFVAEMEYGLDGVFSNWTNCDNRKSDVNPNGINMNKAFMEGYGVKDKNNFKSGMIVHESDINKVKIVKSMGKITKLLEDKNLSEDQKIHLINVGNHLPSKEDHFDPNKEEVVKPQIPKGYSIATQFTIEDTANSYSLVAGDVMEALVNSVPSKEGTTAFQKSNKGAIDAIKKYNEAHTKEIENALNIVAHNDNAFVMNIEINKGDRFKKGLDLADVTDKELDEAAEAFDELYTPINQVEIKSISNGRIQDIIDNITINGRKAREIADEQLAGKDAPFSKKIKYAKAIALRAYANPELHLFYACSKSNVDPTYTMYSPGENFIFNEIKDSVAIKPQDIKIGLKYDVKEGEEVNKDTKFTATKEPGAKVPLPNYGVEVKPEIKDVKIDVLPQFGENINEIIVNAPNQGNIINNDINNNINVEHVPEDQDVVVDPKDVEFYNAFLKYEESIKGAVDWLTEIKAYLKQAQANEEANFGSDVVEGDQRYQEFTEDIQEAIDGLRNGTVPSYALARNISTIMKKADDYIDESFIYADGYHGRPNVAAIDIVNNGQVKQITLYDARLALSFAGSKRYENNERKPYGNLSTDELLEKVSEIEAKYTKNGKLIPAFEAAVKKPDIKEMYKISAKQIAIQNKLKKVSKTMVTNFEYTKKKTPDSYLKMPSMANKRSASALARWFVTKEFLEKVYKPDVKLDQLNELADVSVRTLKAEIKKLSKDPVFKSIVKNHPEEAFSIWDSYKKDTFFEKKYQDMLVARNEMGNIIPDENGNPKPITEDDILNKLFPDNGVMDLYDHRSQERGMNIVARYGVYKALKSPVSAKLRKLLMSADEKVMNDTIDLIVEKYKDAMNVKIKAALAQVDEKSMVETFINDPKNFIEAVKAFETPRAKFKRHNALANGVKNEANNAGGNEAPKIGM